MLLPVIMAGGSGSRLWPLSRSLYPKQFIRLTSEKSMLQETVGRLDGVSHQAPLFICNEDHRFIVAEQLRETQQAHSGILLEPVGRNTAPAIALAALHAQQQGDDPLLLVLAADHVINATDQFQQAITDAQHVAQAGKLVTFGIVPHSPETGYGYIKKGEAYSDVGFHVSEFVEKPALETAEHYVQSGDYCWNSGMFMFKASRFLEELKAHRPDILAACQHAMAQAKPDLDFVRVDEAAFEQCPAESIDYAVMENTQDAVMVPMVAGWSDVGSFSALWEISPRDNAGNAVVGDVLTEAAENNYIYAQDKLVSAVGVEDLVIVETKDAVLVANRHKVQDVKSIVAQLKKQDRIEYQQHREVYRPWGSHDEIAAGDRYHVKHLKIKPGERTALQQHHHRAEHWVVVQGTAKVTNGDKSYLVAENASTFIPLGAPHRIENPGKIDLHLIEVRSGCYLNEDDVVRLEEYGVGY